MVNLEDLLEGLTLAVDAFAICTVPDGEALHLPASDKLTLHFALQGTGEFRGGAGSWRELGRHGLVVAPPNHSLSFKGHGCIGRQAIDCCRTAPAGIEWRGDTAPEAGIVLMCGQLTALYQGTLGLFDFLDEPLLQDFADTPAFTRMMEALLSELSQSKPGAKPMIDALLRECLILLLREQCEGGHCAQPWLSALADPRLGQALMAMVDRPQAGYTVERLAALAQSVSGSRRSSSCAVVASSRRRRCWLPRIYRSSVWRRRSAIAAGATSPGLFMISTATGRPTIVRCGRALTTTFKRW
jgi:hypothetical protein